ncbi:MAG: hypothetical protein J1E85_10205 [Ruminococcus sp.]|nr:hypothetical protein [Ruminococcus sp.]
MGFADFNIIPDSKKLYYCATSGIGLENTSAGIHTSISNTIALDETIFNIFDIADQIDSAIKEW